MATTIRVYLDGGGTAYASAPMNADRTFAVSLVSVPAGTHTFEVTAQEDGKGESARVIQTVVVERGAQQTHPLVADITATGTVAADLTAPGPATQHALQASISAAAMVAADLTVTANTSLEAAISASATTAADLTAPGQQASITYAGAGTEVNQSFADGATVTVPVPPALQDNDLLLIVHELDTNDQSSWPGAVAVTVSGNLGCRWLRASAGQGALTFTASGFDGEGAVPVTVRTRAFAFRGVTATGSPFDGSGTITNSTTTLTGSALTTSVANAMLVMCGRGSASSPGGSVDTMVSGSTVFLAYDEAPSNSPGAQAAPTAIGSLATVVDTLALKPA